MAGAWLAALALLAGLFGCGSQAQEGGGIERPPGLTDTQASAITAGTPRTQLARKLRQDPILISRPAPGTPAGGCAYYAMRGKPLSDVWQVCFDEHGQVSLVATQFAPNQPRPPRSASPTRTALLARGDAVCQADYETLTQITVKLGRALKRLTFRRTAKNRQAVANLISEFRDNLEHTHAALTALRAPSDGRETLTAYLEALASQIYLLGRARLALLGSKMRAYNRYGNEISRLGIRAEQLSREYGFGTCSAARFD